VIVAGAQDLPEGSRVWDAEPVVLSSTKRVIPSGRLVVVEGSDALPDPMASCLALADLGLLDLVVEGGAILAGEWWRAGVINRGIVYLGAKVGGGTGISPLGGVFRTIGDASVVSLTEVRSLGPDFRIDFELS
jgi:diaminohydroxyphosphoribosylaminopyrimidine deaminase/5-amino-6-(5-phosphoribosylamino)uracil reductase